MTPISAAWFEDRAEELKASIAFCTQLPFARATPQAAKVLGKAAWAFPVAGLVVGLVGAVVYVLAHRLGVPPWPAAALSVTGTLIGTGALHEDGLADAADGFGGGRSGRAKPGTQPRQPHRRLWSLRRGAVAAVTGGCAGEFCRCTWRRLGVARVARRRTRHDAGFDVARAAGARRRPVLRGRHAARRKLRRRRGDCADRACVLSASGARRDRLCRCSGDRHTNGLAQRTADRWPNQRRVWN